MSGEGRRLQEWIKSCLRDCDRCEDCSALKAEYRLGECDDSGCSLTLEFVYDDGRYFRWKRLKDKNYALIEALIGKTGEKLTTRVKPLGAEQTIAEALLF
jgi:hypothetical protein